MTETFLTLLVQYSFWLGFSAMAAGALYFALERQSLAVEYQMVATLSAALVAIAAINYWTMKDVGLTLDESGALIFPTHFRYIDWLLTTPMLLAIIPILLNMERGTGALMTKLLVADVIMIAAGYVGETSINAGLFPTVIGWGFYAVGMLAFAFIVFTLYGAMTSAEAQLPPERAKAIGTLKLFITFGWLVYPAGFFFTLVGDGAAPALVRELVYNFADIINKVGFCMVAVAAAKSASYVRVGSASSAPAE
jgi:bacteriorhodopsin